MTFSLIASFISDCKNAFASQIRWCDENKFKAENMEGAAPGGFINGCGYYVIGSTVGGNVVVVSDADARVCFADHTWYGDDQISYQDLRGDKKWHSLDFNCENIKKTMFPLADTRTQFIELLKNGEIDRIIDEVD